MTELNSIEVREGWKKYYLFSFLAFVGIISVCFLIPSQRQGIIDYFFGKWTIAKLPGFIVLFGIMGLCLFYYFDNRVKLKVDRNGIWTFKHKETPWDDIWYFSTTVCNMKEGDLYYLKLRLKDKEDRLDKELKIRYRRMDKDFTVVREIISCYAKQHNIQDLGHAKEM
ncbi:hypothetical protein [Limnovirga soli]|uniref:Uncharacterized protein n=1 Tax=Limnovirga soli TaxID=2656915 RepID=A0A8J8FLQ8_9BACT|nr:hypothetical protein [Limnovirga soli]NNV57144.1 hypothetical protein [Limnovirga soli]